MNDACQAIDRIDAMISVVTLGVLVVSVLIAYLTGYRRADRHVRQRRTR